MGVVEELCQVRDHWLTQQLRQTIISLRSSVLWKNPVLETSVLEVARSVGSWSAHKIV